MDKNDRIEKGRLKNRGTSSFDLDDAFGEMEQEIYEIPKFTTKNSLDNTRQWLGKLGNPSMSKKIIHVAGTNGKGSVCNYLNALLVAEGKTVGMFTSPHLVTMNERVRINGRVIDKSVFLQTYYEVKSIIQEELADGNLSGSGLAHPTFFEILFLLAMVVFEKQNVEKLAKLDSAVDAIRNKYGDSSVVRGSLLNESNNS